MSDTTQPQPRPPKRDPAFPLYADDFLSGTADMSAEEVGAYIRLLCHQWAKGGLPNDEPRLARMAGLIGSPSLGYVVAKFRPCDDGCLRHPRLESIRAEREAYRTRQADSGAAGAEKRWGTKRKHGDPIADPNGKPMPTPMANASPNDSSPSPSPSPSMEREREEVEQPQIDPPILRGNAWPNLDDVLRTCGMLNIPEATGRAFWEHFEAQGWQTGQGLPIVQWTAKLATWWRNEQAKAAEAKAKAAAKPKYRIGTETAPDESF